MTFSLLLAITLGTVPTERPAGLFSPQESVSIVSFWNQPGRLIYQDATATRPYKAVATAEGSRWLYQHYRLRDPSANLIPGTLPPAKSERQQQWDQWIDLRMSQDRGRAEAEAAWRNQGLDFAGQIRTEEVPADLRALSGTPPSFYGVVRDQQVTIDLGRKLIFRLGVDLPAKYLYLRNDRGVSSRGADGPAISDSLLGTINPALRKVIRAVSQLEGSPTAINTYDSGGISFGFLQFASLESGVGSLGAVLRAFRELDPAKFRTLLHDRGIDVDSTGRLSVVDPHTGFECSGRDAVRVFRQDPRLAGALQVAALESPKLVAAQIRVAEQQFNPLTKRVQVAFAGRTVDVPLAKIFRSEAGQATVMDRLVCTGTLDVIAKVIEQAMRSARSPDLAALAHQERALIQQLAYRRDFLADSTLTQPAEGSRPLAGSIADAIPTISGKLGRSSSAAPAFAEDSSVAPFDPRTLGKLPQSSSPSAHRPEPQPGEPVPTVPTPRKPSGPITVPGG